MALLPLLQWNEAGRMCSTNTRPTVLNRLAILNISTKSVQIL